MSVSLLVGVIGALQLAAGIGYAVTGDLPRAAIFLGCGSATIGTVYAR